MKNSGHEKFLAEQFSAGLAPQNWLDIGTQNRMYEART
jgi:hypothetical protein